MPRLPLRDYLIEEYTRTVCPECLKTARPAEPELFIDGMLVSRDGKVWLRRFCPHHGESESLYEEDHEVWKARNGWGTPTSTVTPDRAHNFQSFPMGYTQGLPASHGQHTCVLVLNLTERCNYACPTCYASALPPGSRVADPERPQLQEILHTVKTVIAREGGQLGVCMLSGGEPTVRKDLVPLIDELCKLQITRVMINTNGRRLAKDDELIEQLRVRRQHLEVYLQMDGTRPEDFLALRGEDVWAEKKLALDRLEEAGIFTTLTMTVDRGVNEDRVGEVLMLGLNRPHCAGLAIQPVFGSGRRPDFDDRDRVTPTGVLRRLEAQTKGLVSWRDFIPLPCSHKDCCDITYLLKGSDEKWRSLPTLLGRDRLKDWLHLIANSITFIDLKAPLQDMLQSGALQRVFSEQLKVGALQLAQDIFRICGCAPELSGLLGALWGKAQKDTNPMERLAERTFRVTVKMFMDRHTFHEARIRQCCVHTGTFESDPRRYSFCWRWLFEDARDLVEISL